MKYTIYWILGFYILVGHGRKKHPELIRTEHHKVYFYDCDSAYNFYSKAIQGMHGGNKFVDVKIDSVRIDSVLLLDKTDF